MLTQCAQWWLPPYRNGVRTPDVEIPPIFFRIDIESMTGLSGIPEAPNEFAVPITMPRRT
jgi:hypothetical protein